MEKQTKKMKTEKFHYLNLLLFFLSTILLFFLIGCDNMLRMVQQLQKEIED